MSRKKLIWIIALLAVIAVAVYGYREYSRTNRDIKSVRPDFVLPALDLIREYETSDSIATKKYNGKIIEITGVIMEVEKDENGYYTIVLGDNAKPSSVRCSMDTAHQADATLVSKGQSITVRGACTGFNVSDLGLGSDVILNRCVIIKKEP